MTEQKAERINKYLAQAGICSRRQADVLVEQGKVLVNGKKAESGMKVQPGDKVELVGGKEQKAKLYDKIRDPETGKVTATATSEALTEIIEVLNSQTEDAGKNS